MRAFRSGTQRLRLYKQLPPKRCRARSVRTGLPCRKWSELGTVVCGSHGAKAPQVRAAAARKITLAQALADGAPGRHPWEILDHALRVADVIFRQAVDEVRVDDDTTITAEQFARLCTELERVHRLARGNQESGLAERRQRFAESEAREIYRVLAGVLGRLNLTAEQRAAVPAAVKAEIAPLLAIEGQATETVATVGRPVRKPAAPAPAAQRQLATVAPAPPIVDAAVRPAREPGGREEVARHSTRAIAGALGVSQKTVQDDIDQLTTSSQLSRPAKTAESVESVESVDQLTTSSKLKRPEKPVGMSRRRDPLSELGPGGHRGWS